MLLTGLYYPPRMFVNSKGNFKAIHLLFSVYISLGSSVPSHSVLHLWRRVPTIIRSSLSYIPHCWTPPVHGHLKGRGTNNYHLSLWADTPFYGLLSHNPSLSIPWTSSASPAHFPYSQIPSHCLRNNSSREGLLMAPVAHLSSSCSPLCLGPQFLWAAPWDCWCVRFQVRIVSWCLYSWIAWNCSGALLLKCQECSDKSLWCAPYSPNIPQGCSVSVCSSWGKCIPCLLGFWPITHPCLAHDNWV